MSDEFYAQEVLESSIRNGEIKMKKVINGDELKGKMCEAVNLICDAVSSTLGPSGNNVLIDSELSPFITNDGVTIAESIASEDKCVNSILEIIKEASLKTNELVGDGTTTTLVLLKSIFDFSIQKRYVCMLQHSERTMH